MKTAFNLKQFLVDHRLTIQEFAEQMDIHTLTAYRINKRGTVSIPFIRKIEEKYGDCSQYLQESCEQTTVLAAE